ncbi:hypothetical protein [Aurantimicrobium minutum]|uniref:PGAP1-like alpha/beta domain-containing protein n=1 Tax=Aurantimicrobium minutum TaxID=708131 RepID=UPI0024744306|nr:hypothetical protein [Aurantimicrobium minutum]MDH6423429.1 hypothetical protein [Aurantimicrobium minutum]
MRAGTGADTIALDDLSGRLHAQLWKLEHALEHARAFSTTSPQAQHAYLQATRAVQLLRELSIATAEGSRQYALRESYLRQISEDLSSTLMWNLGRAMPVLIHSFGPAVVGGVAIVLALAAARRLTPGSPFDQFITALEKKLPDSGQFMSQPLVVKTTAHLVSGADDLLAGVLGMPQPARSGPLAGEDLVATAVITGLGVVGATALQETPIRVHQDAAGSTPPPRGYQDLIERIPRADEGAAQIRIEHYPSGYVVYLGGTIDAGVQPTGEPWDMTSNISAIAELDSGSYIAAEAAMRAAGITAQDNVILVGHSQGGLVAAQLAASGNYTVSDVVTVGAPLHQVEIPAEVNLIAVEHAEDVIPSLSGVATTAAVASHVTVTRSLYSTTAAPRGELLPAHNLSRYIETGAVMDRSGDSTISAQHRRITFLTQGDATVTLWRADRVK